MGYRFARRFTLDWINSLEAEAGSSRPDLPPFRYLSSAFLSAEGSSAEAFLRPFVISSSALVPAPSDGQTWMGWKMEFAAAKGPPQAEFAPTIAGWREGAVPDADKVAQLVDRVAEALGRVPGFTGTGIDLASLFPIEPELDFHGLHSNEGLPLLHSGDISGEAPLNIDGGDGFHFGMSPFEPGQIELRHPFQLDTPQNPLTQEFGMVDVLPPLADMIATSIEWGG